MMGDTYYIRSSGSLWRVLFALAAIGLTMAGLVTGNADLYWWAILPTAFFMSCTIGKVLPFRLSLTEVGCDLPDSDGVIEYGQIQGLTIANWCCPTDATVPAGRLMIYHDNGVLSIPRNSGVDTLALYRFLVEQAAQCSSRTSAPNSDLREFWQSQVDAFGSDRVRAYGPRNDIGPVDGNWREMLMAGVPLGLTSIPWLVHGQLHPNPDAMALGGLFAAVLGIVLTVIGLAMLSRPFKLPNWQASSFVFGPKGIGLIQGKHSGTMSWGELKDIRFGPPGKLKFVQRLLPRSLTLEVSGAQIVILDIYDRPLAVIHRELMSLWKPPLDSDFIDPDDIISD